MYRLYHIWSRVWSPQAAIHDDTNMVQPIHYKTIVYSKTAKNYVLFSFLFSLLVILIFYHKITQFVRFILNKQQQISPFIKSANPASCFPTSCFKLIAFFSKHASVIAALYPQRIRRRLCVGHANAMTRWSYALKVLFFEWIKPRPKPCTIVS